MQSHTTGMELEEENYVLCYQCSKYSRIVRFNSKYQSRST